MDLSSLFVAGCFGKNVSSLVCHSSESRQKGSKHQLSQSWVCMYVCMYVCVCVYVWCFELCCLSPLSLSLFSVYVMFWDLMRMLLNESVTLWAFVYMYPSMDVYVCVNVFVYVSYFEPCVRLFVYVFLYM